MSEQTSTELMTEVQKLNPSAIVELYELDATMLGASEILYFHNGTNGYRASVFFANNHYAPLPIEVRGFEMNSSGEPPRPTMSIANMGGFMSALVLDTNDLVGARLTRRRTFVRYLERAADQIVEFQPDVFIIEQKTNENRLVVEFELGSGLDLDGIAFPVRQVASGYCTFDYRGAGCGFAGTIAVNDKTGVWFPGADTWLGDYDPQAVYDTNDSVTWASGGYTGLYRALEDGVTADPDTDPTKWILVQRYRGAYDGTQTNYTVGDVVYVEGVNGYRLFFYAIATTIPSRVNGGAPPNAVYWSSDRCGKFLQQCMRRFDPFNLKLPLPYGGFPGTLNLPDV